MEANREDSVRCLEAAKKEYSLFKKNRDAKVHYENALRLAKKSERMFSSKEAQQLVTEIESCAPSNNNNISEKGARSRSSSGPVPGRNMPQAPYTNGGNILFNSI